LLFSLKITIARLWIVLYIFRIKGGNLSYEGFIRM